MVRRNRAKELVGGQRRIELTDARPETSEAKQPEIWEVGLRFASK
jgi:hypothetical protein